VQAGLKRRHIGLLNDKEERKSRQKILDALYQRKHEICWVRGFGGRHGRIRGVCGRMTRGGGGPSDLSAANSDVLLGVQGTLWRDMKKKDRSGTTKKRPTSDRIARPAPDRE